MHRSHAAPGVLHVLPFVGTVLVLLGIADGISWLLIGASFVPPPLCLLPLLLGVLFCLHSAARPARLPRAQRRPRRP